MKKLLSIIILLLTISQSGYCKDIQIQSIEPMPGFEKVGGPAFGEAVKSYSGQGLVQFVSDTKIMINSKMYFMDDACVAQITSGQIQKASIVTFKLNKQAMIIKLDIVAQLTVTGKIDRIDSNALIINDHYYKLSHFVTYYDISGDKISHYDIDKNDFVGLTFNKEQEINSVWYLNGYYLY